MDTVPSNVLTIQLAAVPLVRRTILETTILSSCTPTVLAFGCPNCLLVPCDRAVGTDGTSEAVLYPAELGRVHDISA